MHTKNTHVSKTGWISGTVMNVAVQIKYKNEIKSISRIIRTNNTNQVLRRVVEWLNVARISIIASSHCSLMMMLVGWERLTMRWEKETKCRKSKFTHQKSRSNLNWKINLVPLLITIKLAPFRDSLNWLLSRMYCRPPLMSLLPMT